MIKAVIFDWSGILCNDFAAVYNADMAVFDAFGMKRLSPNEYKQQAELPWTEFYRKRGITDFEKITAIFVKEFSEDNSAKPIEGAVETLQWLKKKGIKMAVLSAKSEKFLVEECEQFGFNDFIALVESWHDKREAINDIIKRLGVAKEEIVFVGDMVHDIETAKHANIKSVAVLSGYNTKEKLLKAKPDYAIDSVRELPTLIQKLEAVENAGVAANR